MRVPAREPLAKRRVQPRVHLPQKVAETRNPLDAFMELGPAAEIKVPIRGRNKLGQYPKFVREGDNLVKIGWSKSQRAEYEHKSPKRLLAVLCESLTSANGKRIMMDKVLPLKDPVTGSAFPDYQSYLCLAWLRSARTCDPARKTRLLIAKRD